MAGCEKIGFAANSLCEKPLRMDVLSNNAPKFIAVNKPAGILFDSYLGSPQKKSVMLAMRDTPDKPEFKRFGIVSPYAVNQIDCEISGVGIIACDKDAATEMRNAMWSSAIEFEYIFLAKSVGTKEESFDVDLPVLMHEERPVWLVSHRFGKKAHTRFEIIETVNSFQLWKASTRTVRPHQIRVHANESKLKIVGENIYSRTPHVYMSDLKEERYKIGFNEEEIPLYPHLSLHLSKVVFDGKDVGCDGIGKTEIFAPLPKGFATVLKRIGFKYR